jgi:hypothetical protein
MRRAVPIILAVLGTLLVVGSVGSAILINAVDSPAALCLPNEIAGLERSQYMTGGEAAAEFGQLHGEQFLITSGVVGTYGDHNEITIWVAGTPIDFVASQLVDEMYRKISEGRSPFSEVDTLQDNGRTVHVLTGMSQKHYYFRSKNLVIWLATEPTLAEQALQQTLEAYP